MKKKIILVLSFLMVAMCLTGCSATIEGTELEKITEIANHVVNEKNYTLPEGYTVSYPDNTTNARIKIKKSLNDDIYLYLTFDTSQDENKLTEITIFDVSYIYSIWSYIIIILALIGAMFVIMLACELINSLLKKLRNIKK